MYKPILFLNAWCSLWIFVDFVAFLCQCQTVITNVFRIHMGDSVFLYALRFSVVKNYHGGTEIKKIHREYTKEHKGHNETQRTLRCYKFLDC